MKDRVGNDYYISKRGLLLKLFDRFMVRGARSLSQYHGERFAETVIPEMRHRFEEIIPEIPYLGGLRNMFTTIIVVNGMFVVIHQVLRAHGCRAEDSIQLYCDVSQSLFEAIPGPLRHLGGKLMLSRATGWLFKKQAERSQRRLYPEDWVYAYVEGDGQAFDRGLEFSECAVVKFYRAQGVEELEPFCSFFDVIMGRALNMGCVCEPHLGSGGQVCFFQYQWGRETPIPDRLQEFLAT